jgi:Ser/Thr protein kinase RdoA (MazF antagonist)
MRDEREMDDERIRQFLGLFGRMEQVTEWKPFGHGHINDTFLIRTVGDNLPDYILQRKNHVVFKDVPGMLNNILLATNHVRAKLKAVGEPEIDRKVMTYLPTADGKYYVQDDHGNYWTLFLFIRDSHGIEEVTSPDQAFSAGKAFGHFQRQLSDLDPSGLIDTIPNFHNGKFRFQQFSDAIASNKAVRLSEMQSVVDQLLKRKEEMLRLQSWLDDGALPRRITHNDTKINNILFDENNNILCIIDLDTIMPGSILFDFGDAIRTLGNSAAEDEADVSKISFQTAYFEAFTKGYLSESSRFLTSLEIENLVYSCRYMVWEQAVRFLTDYLNGDTYYKIAYPAHNKVRTLSQLRYLEVLEANIEVMGNCVSQSL